MQSCSRHLVLVGAGHAHVEVLRAFGRAPVPGLRLTLITREAASPYSGMLPGVIAGAYARGAAEIDASALARFAGAELLLDEAVGLDPLRREVHLRAGPAVGYDVVSLDIGSRPGAPAEGIAVKPIDRFFAAFASLHARVLAGAVRRIVLVGGGAAGVELLLAVDRRLRRDTEGSGLEFTLVQGGADILPGFPDGFRARIRRVFARRGIAIATGAAVVAVEKGMAVLADGRRIGADCVLWATQASPAVFLRRSGLDCDEAGFLRVDGCLRAPGRADVFAAGDMIDFAPRPIPRSGVYAVRAGPVLAHNLRAAVGGGRLIAYRPQRRALVILSTADGSALATRGGLTVEGAWVQRWKERIDRRFMARYQGLAADGTTPPAKRLA